MRISVVIPALDEAACLAETLDAVRPQVDEIIVVDGGSRDATVAIARGCGARVLTAPRGRGAQLRAGAAVAGGDVLWFVHADTRPPRDGAERIRRLLADPAVAGGNFGLRFDSRRPAARFLSWLYPRLGFLGLHYGDSAIFVRRGAYLSAGGFATMPLFEDVELVRRLRRHGRFHTLDAAVLTSSRRFENRAVLPVIARWTFLQLLYWAGVSPARLAKMYPVVRA